MTPEMFNFSIKNNFLRLIGWNDRESRHFRSHDSKVFSELGGSLKNGGILCEFNQTPAMIIANSYLLRVLQLRSGAVPVGIVPTESGPDISKDSLMTGHRALALQKLSMTRLALRP